MTTGSRGWWALGLVLLAGVGAGAGRAQAQEPAGTWTLMAYLRTAGGLGETAAGYLEQWQASLSAPGVRVAAQVEEAGVGGGARRLTLDRTGRHEAGRVPGGDPDSSDAVADFLRWGAGAAPAQQYLLVVLAHGPVPGQEAADAPAGLVRLASVAEALRRWEEPQLEILFLDRCYSGTAPQAAGFVGLARYLVAPPGELYEPGLPWGRILAALQEHPQMTGRSMARVAVQETRRAWRGPAELTVGLVGMELDQVPEVTQALQRLAQVGTPRMGQLAAPLTLASSLSARWGAVPLVDLEAFGETLAGLTSSPEVAQAARELSVAAQRATLGAWAQEGAEGTPSSSGMALEFPTRGGAAGGAAEGWEGWRGFSAAYLQSLAGAGADQESGANVA